MDRHNNPDSAHPALPRHARLPINRCNLPPAVLGRLSFQRHPVTLEIDGVATLHRALFRALDPVGSAADRALLFQDYLRVNFLLDAPEDAGYDAGDRRPGRPRLDYRRVVRGWMFDPDGREAAVLKGWVESRFGLLPRSDKGPLDRYQGDNYLQYQEARARGLCNTNALESQLDLLYAYCQYELARTRQGRRHCVLYRGVNALAGHEQLHRYGPRDLVILFNNINSFTGSAERADEFGDCVLRCRVPLAKLVCYPGLLPGALSGEDEHLVIGGLYRARVVAL